MSKLLVLAGVFVAGLFLGLSLANQSPALIFGRPNPTPAPTVVCVGPNDVADCRWEVAP